MGWSSHDVVREVRATARETAEASELRHELDPLVVVPRDERDGHLEEGEDLGQGLVLLRPAVVGEVSGGEHDVDSGLEGVQVSDGVCEHRIGVDGPVTLGPHSTARDFNIQA